jgi:hypothetical protein
MTTATEKRTLTMVSGIFRDRKKAGSFHHCLTQSGFTSEHIHVLMSEDSRRHYNEEPDSQIKPDNKAVEGVATGGTIGTVIGATLGAVAAIGTSVLVPGLGIAVAGPILAGLVGGGAGAITGGLDGGLIGLGIPESNGAA